MMFKYSRTGTLDHREDVIGLEPPQNGLNLTSTRPLHYIKDGANLTVFDAEELYYK